MYILPNKEYQNYDTNPIHIIQILSRALLPTKDPRRREDLLPTQRKPNKISQSLHNNQVPNIPITIQYPNRIPIQGNPITHLPPYPKQNK